MDFKCKIHNDVLACKKRYYGSILACNGCENAEYVEAEKSDKPKPVSQNQLVLDYLLNGNTLTRAEAYEKWGITELNTRIHDLRKMGYTIMTQNVTVRNRYGKLVSVARYNILNVNA